MGYCGDFLEARAAASFGNAWSACVRGTWVRGVTVPDSTSEWRIYRVRGGHGHSGALQEAPSAAPFGDGENWALSMVAPRGWVNRAVATVRREYPAAAVEFDAWFAHDEACVITSAWLRRGYGEFRFQLFGASHARAW